MAARDRGRRADRPSEIPARGWRDIVLRVWRQVGEHHVSIVAAGVAFYAMLAIFPAITAFVSLYGLIADPAQVERQFAALRGVVPDAAWILLNEQLKAVAAVRPGSLGLGAAIGLLIALWSAGAGVRALMTALNIVYREEEKRGIISFSLTGLALTCVLVGGAMVSLTVIVAVPLIFEFLRLGELVETAIGGLTWLGLAVLVVLGLAVLYRYGPSRRQAKLRWVSWGAVVATALWLLASILFSLYAASFADYNKTYGALGAVIVLLMWFWISAYVVLLGAELNAEMEHQTRKDTGVGRTRPMGERGAFVADHVGEVP